MEKHDNMIVLKDVRHLYREFLSAKEIYQKYKAFQDMEIFHDLFSNCDEIDWYYQNMSSYLNNHSEELEEEKRRHNYEFDLYLSRNFSFFENNLPFFPVINTNSVISFKPLTFYNIDFLLESFFWSTSHNLYRFYKRICNLGKIFQRDPKCQEEVAGFKNGEENGLAFSASIKRERSYVYVNRFETIEDLASLVHEIGHAYFFSVVKYKYEDMIFPEKEMRIEIPSRTLEYMFIQYLKSLNIQEAFLLEENFFKQALLERGYQGDLFIRYKYTIANLCAVTCASRINREISFERYCKAVYCVDFEKMLLGTCNRYYNQMYAFQKRRTN